MNMDSCFRRNDGMGPDESGVIQCPTPRSRIKSGMTDPGFFSRPSPRSRIKSGMTDPGSILIG
jgi:hypothetical protein